MDPNNTNVSLPATQSVSLPIINANGNPVIEVINTSGDIVRSTKPLKEYQKKIMTNLKPFRKGDGRKRGVRPKGAISMKTVVSKRLQQKNANKIVDVLIAGAEQGEDKKTETLLKLTGDLMDKPQINIQQNTLTVDANLIEAAKQFLLEKEKSKAGAIIDITPLSISDKANENEP